jgi:hypothetical protein
VPAADMTYASNASPVRAHPRSALESSSDVRRKRAHEKCIYDKHGGDRTNLAYGYINKG